MFRCRTQTIYKLLFLTFFLLSLSAYLVFLRKLRFLFFFFILFSASQRVFAKTNAFFLSFYSLPHLVFLRKLSLFKFHYVTQEISPLRRRPYFDPPQNIKVTPHIRSEFEISTKSKIWEITKNAPLKRRRWRRRGHFCASLSFHVSTGHILSIGLLTWKEYTAHPVTFLTPLRWFLLLRRGGLPSHVKGCSANCVKFRRRSSFSLRNVIFIL